MDKKAAFLVTVGTSILNRIGGELDRLNLPKELRDKLDGAGKLPASDPKQATFEESIKRRDDLYRTVLDIVRKDPEKYSAELNTIIKFLRVWGRAGYLDELKIVLYPTDTGNCRFCAEIIRDILLEGSRLLNLKPECKVVCEIINLRGFGTSVEFFFGEGLCDLLDKYAGYIVNLKRNNYIIVLMPIGGYKPESTYATIIGLIFGVSKVVYVHETFREVVELPLVPLDVSSRFIEIIEKIKDLRELSRQDVEDLGLDVDELVESGILVKEGPGYRIADWILKLLELRRSGS